MKRSLSIAAALAFTAICLGSCTKEKIVAPVVPKATVSGVVYAWRCDVCDWINNHGDVRYSVQTGRSATVKLVRADNCCTTIGATDDSSVYEIRAAKGEYNIVVETPYARPDTLYDITLTADTIIDLDFIYETQTPDTISIWCKYDIADDTMYQSVERGYIYSFNQWIGNMLKVDSMVRKVYGQFPPVIFMEYRIPTQPEYAPWQVEEKVHYVWGGMPDNMSFATDTYICLD